LLEQAAGSFFLPISLIIDHCLLITDIAYNDKIVFKDTIGLCLR